MPSKNAAYMREYRARKKAATPGADPRDARIAALEEEVRHLKSELAKRPTPMQPVGEMRPVVAEQIGHAFNSRPFTPVPRRRLPKTE